MTDIPDNTWLLIIGLIGALVPIIQPFVENIIRRKRSYFIECQEVQRTELPRWRQGTTQANLRIQINDKIIQSPSFSRIRARNMSESEKSIENVCIQFHAEGAKIVEIVPSPVDVGINTPPMHSSPASNGDRELILDYLNAYPLFREDADIEFDILFDGTLQKLSATGRGKGWQVKFHDLASFSRREARASLLIYTCIFLWLITIPIIESFLNSDFNSLLSIFISSGFIFAWLIPPIIFALTVWFWTMRTKTAIPGPSEAIKRLLGRKRIDVLLLVSELWK